MANSDNDSVVDEYDNCLFMTNENQADIDENGIGDVCDIFSSQNISIAKRNTSCPENENGVLTFDARAEYVYTASIIGSNGFQRELIFTPQGKILGNLAAGNYSICVRTDSFLDFEYCFETEISSPPLLEVSAVLDPSSSVLDLDISGAEQFNVIINGQTKTYTSGEKIQIELTQKTNFVKVNYLITKLMNQVKNEKKHLEALIILNEDNKNMSDLAINKKQTEISDLNNQINIYENEKINTLSLVKHRWGVKFIGILKNKNDPLNKLLKNENQDLKELITPNAVSYTHLRAHETVLDLVCRLLLEKKKQ